jgi:hypothetical protein
VIVVVGKFRKPDRFTMFTRNFKWLEITSRLKLKEKIEKQADFVQLVFCLKFIFCLT